MNERSRKVFSFKLCAFNSSGSSLEGIVRGPAASPSKLHAKMLRIGWTRER